MSTTYAHILVVDDSPRRSKRLVRPFEAWGWSAARVDGDTEAALAALAQGEFDLVALDITAAEQNDHAFLRRWKVDPALNRVPVVVTATPGTALARLARCVEHGASDYISHPANTILLHARLLNSMQKKLLAEQAAAALDAFNEIEKLADMIFDL